MKSLGNVECVVKGLRTLDVAHGIIRRGERDGDV
jgi:hypothetical protein